MGYLERFKVIVKDVYGSGRVFCELHGLNYGYYRKVTGGSKGCVRWIEMFVIAYELGSEKKIVEPQAVECGCVEFGRGGHCVICCEPKK